MSPALVDIRTPSKHSSSASSSFLPNPNPKSHIFYSSNSFLSSMKSSIRNAKEGGFDYNFPSETEKLRSVSGRTIPRLVKLRKSNRGRSTRSNVNTESQVRSDFNPFVQVSSQGSVRVDDDTRFQDLYEKYYSPNSLGSNSSGSSVSGDCEFGKSNDSGFVFGATNWSNDNNNVSNSEKSGFDDSVTALLHDELNNLKIGSGIHFQSSKEATFSTADRSKSKSFGGSSKTNAFVFGTSSKKDSDLDGNLASKLPDELGKLNIKSFGNADSVEKAKDQKPGDTNTSAVFGRSSSLGSSLDKSTDSKLPDKLQNLNVKDTGNANVGKTNVANFSSKGSEKNNTVFGAPSALPNEMKKLNIDELKVDNKVEETKGDYFEVKQNNAFVFGNIKKDSESFRGNVFNNLPAEMSNLNIRSNIGKPSVFPDTTSSPSSNAKPEVSTDKVCNDAGLSKSIPATFSFNATKQSRGSSVGSDHSDKPNDDSKSSEGSSFYSAGRSFQSDYVYEEPSMDRAENKGEFSFGTPHMDFTSPIQDDSCSSTTNLFAEFDQKLKFSSKKGAVKDTRSKKKKGKLKQPSTVFQWAGQPNISSENSFEEKTDSSVCYSPMDFSPCQENEYIHLGTDLTADAHSSASVDAVDEDLVTATESLDINVDDVKGEASKEGSMDNTEKDVCIDESVSGVQTDGLRSKTDADIKNDVSFAATEGNSGLHSHLESKGNDDRMEFCFASSFENVSGTNFTFAASTSAQSHTSAAKRIYKKKSRSKVGQDLYSSTLNSKLQFVSPDNPLFPLSGTSSHVDPESNRKGDSTISESIGDNKAEVDEKTVVKQGPFPRGAAVVVAHEACEKWRLRGNQAYANGNLSKAEDYYTRGLNCVPGNETSESCLTALMLCYSNRAAARMSCGRMREALEDCKKAAEINPDFRKVQVRAANCHLALGEIEDALKYFKNCLPSVADLCLDRKIVIEASNGLQKAQQVGEYVDRCVELLQRRSSNDAESALQLISEAMLISPNSENLVEMKTEALLVLRKYEEVIQLCEQSLDSAEKNSPSVIANGTESLKNCPARLWRWHLMAKSYFYMGRLEEALGFIEKVEAAASVAKRPRSESKTLESSSTLAVTVRLLLRHKTAGNEAFQSGRHSEAVEHYTSALSCNLESRLFAAICFCNRAAAHQALGQIADAIADCSLAIALDGSYVKAISRRATLHEMIKDFSHAALDLQRLVCLLEKQAEEKVNQSGKLGRSTSGIIDLKQAYSRLSTAEEEARKGISLDLYLIL
ncbi:Tpr repeat-containing thioredoxin ttl4 [Thalictrum thalictroides]|uniref:Tpr repeat-containing thioredoxin ttl4 n=1 Tax=Thalictrum thalictroides TaxID=46969 RepID=A0A7J6X5K7_THATH|nr:Tpr repeat-containing thioredoxin ttl4 [Thalictrum thalictroides]